MEKTLLIVKPDIIWQDEQMQIIVHEILPQIDFESIEVRSLTLEEVKELYMEHEGREYYTKLVNHMLKTKVVIIVAIGKNAVIKGRDIVRDIRLKYAHHDIKHENCLHGSDSLASAEREVALFAKGQMAGGVEPQSKVQGIRLLYLLNNYKSGGYERPLPKHAEEIHDLLDA